MDSEQRCASGTDGNALRDAVRFPPPYAEQMRKQGVWNDDTVPRWLSRFAHETPDKAAIVTATEAISYRETFARAERLARALAALGLRKGDVIAVQLPMCRSS
jgi:cyclohexanecarboxylate-CoA ligase